MSFQPLPDELVIDPFVVTSLTGPDNHTGLYLDADQTNSSILIKTNDTNAAYIDKFQNFGINTTAPGAQLDVNSASGSCIQITYNKSANKANLGVSSDGKLSLSTSGGEVSVDSASDFNVKAHNGTTTGLKLNNTLVRASADQINYNVVTPGTATASKSIVVDSNKDVTGLRNFTATNLTGTIQTAAQPNINSVNVLDVATHNGSTVGLALGGVIVTATAAQLNYNNVTQGTASVSKALILDDSLNIAGINSLSATNLTGTLQTAAQPNITSVGTLTDLDISGSITGLTDLSINTTSSGRSLIVNSDVGNCFQLCYDTASGAATNYVDMLVSSTGNLSITPSGGDVDITTHDGTNGLKLGGIVVTASADQINYLQGTTPGTAADGKALIVNSSRNIANINNLTATNLTGTLQTAAQPNINSVNVLNVANHNGTIGLALGGTIVTATASELNYTDVTQGSAAASKALVLDSSLDISGINSLSATSLTGTIQTPYQPSITSVDVLDVTLHDGTTEGLSLGGVLLTATAAQLNALAAGGASPSFTDLTVDDTITITNANGVDKGLILGSTLVLASATQLNYNVVTPGTASASKALVLDSSSDISGINSLSATYLTGELQTAAQPNITSVGTLDNIATSGTFTMGSTVISAAEIGVIDGVTAGTVTASKAVVVDANKDISSFRNLTATNLTGTLQTAAQTNITSVGTLDNIATSGTLTMGSTTISEAEIGVIDGVTAGTVTASKAVVVDANKDISSFRNLTATNLTGTLQTAAQANITSVGTLTSITTSGSLTMGSTTISEAEIGVIDGVTAGTVTASKAIVVDANKDISSFRNLTASGLVTSGTGSFTGTTDSTTVGTGTITTAGGVGIAKNAYIGGSINVTSTTDSTSTASGSIITTGGLGIAKNAYIGGTANVTGITTISNATASTTSSTGALVVTGGAGVGGALNVGGAAKVLSTTDSTTVSTGAMVVSGGVGVGKSMYVNNGVNISGQNLVVGAVLGGTTWTNRSASQANPWTGITWAPSLNLFVAVAGSGTNQVMTSSDGITWNNRTASGTDNWWTVVWAPEISTFVVTAYSGSGGYVMTSTNGTSWTGRTASQQNPWYGLCWSPTLNLFVAVAYSGSNQVMTSPNGITWTNRSAASSGGWTSVCWATSLGLFVAVSASAASRVMTSPDGITWTPRTASAANGWRSIAWAQSLGRLVAVGDVNANQIMTSSDGINWTNQTSPENNAWIEVTWAPEIPAFIAVATSGTNRVMTSPDGITWTARTASQQNTWECVAWAPSINTLAAVSTDGTNRVMTSVNTPGSNTSALIVSGSADVSSNFNLSGVANATNTTDASSTSSGAVIVSGGVGIAKKLYVGTGIFGTISTAAQANITSVGTLTSITTSGSLTMGSTVISEAEIGVLDAVTAGTVTASKAVVVDANKDISSFRNLTATNLTGTLQTAAQANITSVGTLTSIATSGSFTMGTTVISEAEIGVLDGVTPGTASASKALVLDSSSDITGIDSLTATSITGTLQTAAQANITSVGTLTSIATSGSFTMGTTVISEAEIGVLDGVTPGTAVASKALVLDSSLDISGINSLSATDLTGTIQTAAQPNISSVDILDITLHDGSTQGLSLGGILLTATATQLNDIVSGGSSSGFADVTVDDTITITNANGVDKGLILGSTLVLASADQLNYNVVTPGTASASKALVLDASSDITGINSLSATAITGELQTAAQPNVTSVGTLTSVTTSGSFTMGTTVISEAEIGVLDGVTPGTASASKALVLNSTSDITGINSLSASELVGDIQTASQTNITSVGTLTSIATSGDLTMGTTVISEAEIGVIDGVTAGTVTASKAVVVDANKDISSFRNLTATNLTGTLQTAAQANITSVGTLTSIATSGALTMGTTVISEAEIGVLDAVTPGTVTASKAIVVDTNKDISSFRNLTATNLTGTIQTAAQPNISSVDVLDVTLHDGSTQGISLGGVLLTATAAELNALAAGGASPSFVDVTVDDTITITNANGVDKGLILGSTLVLASADQLNYNVVTPGTAAASKTLVLDSSSDISGINSLSATSLTGELQTAAQPNITSVGTLTSITTSGSLTMGTTVISEAEIGVLDGVTAGTVTASKAVVVDANKDISSFRNLTATNLTGTLQTAAQTNITSVGTLTSIATSGSLTMGTTVISEAEIGVLDAVTPGTAAASKALVLDSSSDISGINSLSASELTGTLQSASQPNITSVNVLNIDSHDGFTVGLSLNSILVTATATEINYVDVAQGTATASKALVLDASKDISGINSLSATSLTGEIQTAAQPNITSVGTLTSITTSGDIDCGGNLIVGGTIISESEIVHLDGATPGTAEALKAMITDADNNISGVNAFGATSITGTLQTAAQTNITSVGTLTSIATSGSLTMGTTVISEAEIGVLDGVTAGTVTASKAVVVDANKDISSFRNLTATNLTGTLQTAAQTNITSIGTLTSIATSGSFTMGTTVISEAEIGVLDGVTPGTAAASKALVLDSSSDISGINSLSATSLTGTLQTAYQPNISSVDVLDVTLHDGSTQGLSLGGVLLTATAAELNALAAGGASPSFVDVTVDDTITITNANGIDKGLILGSTLVLASAAQLNYNVVTPGTASASKTLVLDSNSDISGINSLSADALTGTLQTAAQTNITSVGTLTSITTSGSFTMGTTVISEAEIGVIDGVTAGTVTASKAVVVDSNKDISSFRNLTATNLTGTIQTADQANITSVGTLTSIATSGSLTMGTTVISEAEIGVLDSVTPGTASASKALVLDSSSDISGINSLSTAVLAIGSPANSDLPVEIGYTSYQYTGEYAYNNESNAHGIVTAGDGPVANYSLRTDGRIMATGEIELTSDRRLKKNIENLTFELSKKFIMTTTPVKFNWKSGDSVVEYGYIAQSVLKAGFNDLVNVTAFPGIEGSVDEDGFINPKDAKFVFSPGKIIPLLALNQKEVFNELAEKDQKIKDLEERLARLEALLL